MSYGWTGRDQRRAPRVEVLMRVKGHLVALDAPIVIHDLSRTGFSVLSKTPFDAGQTLDFRLESADGQIVGVTARAIHTRPMPGPPGLYLSGFTFVAGRLTGRVPHILIDQLIETVTGQSVAS
jgi:hypothetical protein